MTRRLALVAVFWLAGLAWIAWLAHGFAELPEKIAASAPPEPRFSVVKNAISRTSPFFYDEVRRSRPEPRQAWPFHSAEPRLILIEPPMNDTLHGDFGALRTQSRTAREAPWCDEQPGTAPSHTPQAAESGPPGRDPGQGATIKPSPGSTELLDASDEASGEEGGITRRLRGHHLRHTAAHLASLAESWGDGTGRSLRRLDEMQACLDALRAAWLRELEDRENPR